MLFEDMKISAIKASYTLIPQSLNVAALKPLLLFSVIGNVPVGL